MNKLIGIILLIFSKTLIACQCDPIEPITNKLVDTYNVIFYGKVDSVAVCSTNGLSTAYFSILELYKGAVTEHVKVDFDCASSCLMSFEKGEQWIIYASYQHFDLLTVSICEHSRKLFTDKTKDYYQITAKRSFDEEKSFLKTLLGLKKYAIKNELNQQQLELKPHNDQPSGMNKLLLLFVSLISMLIVLLLIRWKRK